MHAVGDQYRPRAAAGKSPRASSPTESRPATASGSCPVRDTNGRSSTTPPGTQAAINVPVYETSSPEQIHWILSDSGAVAVFLESEKNKQSFEQVATELPSLTRVWVFDDGVIDELERAGETVSDEDLEAGAATLTPTRMATIIYTSGTTGRPKGCVLTHRTSWSSATTSSTALPERSSTPETLDAAVPADRARVRPRHPDRRDPRRRPARALRRHQEPARRTSQSFQPTFLLAVPRVFEKVFNSAQQKAAGEGKGKIFDSRGERRDRLQPRPSTPAAPACCCGSSTRCSTGSSTASCAPRWAATCSGRSPAARRSAHGSATSSAASA